MACTPSTNDQEKLEIVKDYVAAYNAFDVPGMVSNFSDAIVFENVSNGTVEMRIEGIGDFVRQAEEAKQYFSSRKQDIVSWEVSQDTVTIAVDYVGVLAMDIPEGPKKGDTLSLKGKSTFVFEGNKIKQLVDES